MAVTQEFCHPNIILVPVETKKNQLPFLLRLIASVEMIVCVLRDPGDTLRLLDYSV
jgi:hypothetical protein